MADTPGPRESGVEASRPAEPPAQARARFFELVARAPHMFDFYQLLRRLESVSGDLPRLGTAALPTDEPIRLGQEPSLAFAPAQLASLLPSRGGGPPWLRVFFFGLFGPNGPLPLHLTEYAADRQRNASDPTFGRFADMFHHRLLLLFYRAWSSAQPTADADRRATSRFPTYVGAFAGIGLSSLRDRDGIPDATKLHYGGRFAARTRNPEGLAAVVGDFFGMAARVQPFVPAWLDIPPDHRWALARGERRLGRSTVIGGKTFSRAHKFRLLLGPLNRKQFQSMLPGQPGLSRLTALVRNYSGDALEWDVKLSLDERSNEPLILGRSRLGWTSWLGAASHEDREDLILNPEINFHQARA
jgi:type VI secretion system protein ImpH